MRCPSFLLCALQPCFNMSAPWDLFFHSFYVPRTYILRNCFFARTVFQIIVGGIFHVFFRNRTLGRRSSSSRYLCSIHSMRYFSCRSVLAIKFNFLTCSYYTQRLCAYQQYAAHAIRCVWNTDWPFQSVLGEKDQRSSPATFL